MPYTFNPFTGKLDYYAAGGGVGPQGVAGARGVPGPAGDDGEDGLPGTPGPQGLQGLQGIQGNAGVSGPAGSTGTPGLDGADGDDGLTVVGPPGAQGPAGNNGSAGTPGAAGPAGVMGMDGQDGEEGSIWLISAPSTGGGGSGVPATTVVSETTPGQAPVVGVLTSYAREDHSHGTPAAGASGPWTFVQNSTTITDTMTVPAGYQFQCGRTFNNVGAIVNNGDFIITH